MARCVCGEHDQCPANCMVGAFNPCRSGCSTQDHGSYSECLKSANLGIARGESAPAQF